MRVEVGRLTSDRINRETRMAICDMWSGAESLTDEKKTDPKLMRTIYDNNSPDDLRREVSRLDSGIYVVQRLGRGGLLAAAIVTTKRGGAAPQYGDSQAGRPMYMEIFGASADAEEAWPGYLQSIVDQARKDFGRSMGSRVTKLCAYASPNANKRFPDAVRSINPRTYEKHGGEEGSFGVVGGVYGSYVRHDVEFEIPQTGYIREVLNNATYLPPSVPSKSPLDELVSVRTGSTEEVPVAA